MEQLFDCIDSKKEELIGFVRQLVRIPTVNPPGENYPQIVNLLEKKCRQIGLSTKRHRVPQEILKKNNIDPALERINLVARWDNGSKKTLHFNGHYDVVPVTSGWTVKPFEGSVKDGKIYGRGTEDMKGTIASMIFAIEAVKKLGIKPKVNIELSLVPDEETGGFTGLNYLVNKKIVRPDYAVGEGFSGKFVSIGNKGALWLEVRTKGLSCHASMPYKGRNAFKDMLKVAGSLAELEKKIGKVRTKSGTRDKRDAFATMVLGGKIEGGKKVNIVPDHCYFTIDRRVLPEEDIKKVESRIRQAVAKLKKKDKYLNVDIKVLFRQKPVVVDKDGYLCKVMARCIKSVYEKNARFGVMPGATDVRFFINNNIPVLGYSAQGQDRAHADDEFVYIKSLLDTAKVYALLMTNLNPAQKH